MSDITTVDPMPIATLKNGLRVANFSSFHMFTFDDGTVLPGCSRERCEAGMLEAKERHIANTRKGKSWIDIELSFRLNEKVSDMVRLAVDAYQNDELDIVIVPLPVLKALQEHSNYYSCNDLHPFRTIRMKDRVEKIAYSDRFCF